MRFNRLIISSKALLSYHVAASKCDGKDSAVNMPLQWSSAFEGLTFLIGIVTLNELFCFVNELMSTIDDCMGDMPEVDANLSMKLMAFTNYWTKMKNDIIKWKNVANALRMDDDWLSTRNAKVVLGLIAALSASFRTSFTKKAESSTFTGITNSIMQMELKSLRDDLSVLLGGNSCELSYTSYGGLNNVWIVKPVGLSCGEKIVCTQNIMGVLEAAKSLSYKCVVQKYIEKPLLVRGRRKCDIRQWVLVTSADPLVLYGFSECYLRLSGEDFSLDSDSLKQSSIHLCNHAIQKQNVSKRTASTNEQHDAPHRDTEYCETMMSQQEFEEELQRKKSTRSSARGGVDNAVDNEKHIFDNKILPDIKNISVNVVKSVRDKLLRVGKGFEWLGLDLMVVERDDSPSGGRREGGIEFEVLLVEVNVSPDISLSTPVTKRLVEPAVVDLFDLLLDEGALDDPEAAADSKSERNSFYHSWRSSDVPVSVRGDDPSQGTESSTHTHNHEHCTHSEGTAMGSASLVLRWNLWHRGLLLGKRESLAFSRAKQNVAPLGSTTDYLPRNVGTAERVMELLSHRRQAMSVNSIEEVQITDTAPNRSSGSPSCCPATCGRKTRLAEAAAVEGEEEEDEL